MEKKRSRVWRVSPPGLEHPRNFPSLLGWTSLLGLITHTRRGLGVQHLRPGIAVRCHQQCWRAEVEELAHVSRGIGPVRISRGERLHGKRLFDERENGGVIARRMGDEIRLRVRRDHDQGYAKSGERSEEHTSE